MATGHGPMGDGDSIPASPSVDVVVDSAEISEPQAALDQVEVSKYPSSQAKLPSGLDEGAVLPAHPLASVSTILQQWRDALE